MVPAESTTHSGDSSSSMVNFDDVAAWLKAYLNIWADVEPWMIKNMIKSMHTDLVKQKLTKEQFEQQ